MSVDKFGRHHDRPHVSYMRWRPNNEGERQLGLRVGYGDAFLWIPDYEAIDLATKLVDFITENPPNSNSSPAAQESNE